MSPHFEARAARLSGELSGLGQEHVLRFLPELDAAAADQLLSQLEALDLPRLGRLIDELLAPTDESPADAAAGALEPAEILPVADDEAGRQRDTEAREAGEELLASGRVGAFLVAGGQGTRLGYDGPKGRFPVGPLTRRSLFAYHAHRVLASSRRYGASLPYYVMTSAANHASTVAAFEEAQWFGLDREQVRFLTQGMLPAIDREGKLLLATRSSLALSPDGHGGCFAAMQSSGALDDMRARGLSELFYFQVDNPLARVFDPVFLGHHLLARSEMSTKVVEKSEPGEKVGVLARRGERHCLLEYSDLPAELAEQRDAEGKLRYRAGNIAIHALHLPFVERLLTDGGGLPVHRADKRVPHVDAAGRRVEPDEPNGIKLEMFVFDALGRAERVVQQEVRREDEFAPVKNAEGPDSPATAEAALSSQAKRWMAAAGLSVPDGQAEVGPLFALDADEFQRSLTRSDFGPAFDRA